MIDIYIRSILSIYKILLKSWKIGTLIANYIIQIYPYFTFYVSSLCLKKQFTRSIMAVKSQVNDQ